MIGTSTAGLGILLAALAAALFALGAVGQRHGVRHQSGARGGLGVREGLALLRNRRWLAGTGLVAGGSAVHLAGLALAPVTVVQPVGTLSVPFSVALDNLRGRRRPARATVLSCVLTVAGVLTFSLVAALRMASTAATVSLPNLLLVLGVAWGASAALLAGSRLSAKQHALPWAAAGGLCYGLATSLLKVLLVLVNSGAALTSPVTWVAVPALVISFALGGWCIQQAYARGSAAGVVACQTVTDPAVAVLSGLLVLGEARGLGTGSAVLMSCAGLVAGLGAWRLSLERTPDAGHTGVLASEENR